ncbi:MAG: 3-oxoacyl-acyl-carrier-protein synthase III [Halothiobacillaceae bacterium]|nr:MAG: 3-oxoacyl-acyl-carrier-protein synthase III [Halothiobacillaceae bacterium]
MTNEVFITRVAAYLPNEPVTNDEIESVLGVVNNKRSRALKVVLKNNGIKTRYYVLDKNTGKPIYNNAQLTAMAVRALQDDTFSIEAIQCLACGTTIADQIVPGHAVMVHGELGNPPCETASIMGVCSASVSALKYGYLNVLSGCSSNAVVTGSEVASLTLRASSFASAKEEAPVEELHRRPELAFEKDFLRWMLSDGAGAVLLEAKPRLGQLSLRIDWIEILSFANVLEACMYAGAEKDAAGHLIGWREFSLHELVDNDVLALKQDVKLLNKYIVPLTVERGMAMVAAKHKLTVAEIDYFLPHISSEYFRAKLAQGLENIGFPIPQERWFTNLATKGNTGSASVYIMLEELFNSGRLRSGQRVLCFVPESGRFTSSFVMLTAV